jgi:hypothetical protein
VQTVQGCNRPSFFIAFGIRGLFFDFELGVDPGGRPDEDTVLLPIAAATAAAAAAAALDGVVDEASSFIRSLPGKNHGTVHTESSFDLKDDGEDHEHLPDETTVVKPAGFKAG